MSTTTSAASGTAQSIWESLSKRTASTDSTSAMSESQNRFLTLLTTQLKNQDPLNPMDNAQMTSQLAQISTVDGIERLNATLQTLLAGNVDAQAMQAADLVGRHVLVPGSAMTLSSGQALGGIELASDADKVVVTVKDASGLTVRTIDLGTAETGVFGFAWDGKTDSGAAAADGNYKFEVTATQGANKVGATALSLATVSSINRSSLGVSLNLGRMGLVTMADVKQIL